MNGHRRSYLLYILAVGAGLIVAAILYGQRLMLWLFLPRLELDLPESAFDAGSLSEYRETGVYTRLKKDYGVWIVHQTDGSLVALSTVCTHLGCTPDWQAERNKFKCPCHGSEYNARGVNIKGPTKRPLERYAIRLERGRVVVDKARVFRREWGEWNSPYASIPIGRLQP